MCTPAGMLPSHARVYIEQIAWTLHVLCMAAADDDCTEHCTLHMRRQGKVHDHMISTWTVHFGL